jgi:pyruvate kinase
VVVYREKIREKQKSQTLQGGYDGQDAKNKDYLYAGTRGGQRKKAFKTLLLGGVNAVRINFSHGTHETHKITLDRFKAVRDKLGLPVASILDTKGPEIRVKNFETGSVELTAGAAFTITTDDVVGNETIVSTTYHNLHNELKPGDRILLDDGLIELKVGGVEGPTSTAPCSTAEF